MRNWRRGSCRDRSPAIPYLEEVEKNARRAADLVQQILAYAGKGRFVVQAIDLSTLVWDMAGLLSTAVSSRAELRYELTERLPPVEADVTQLRQVLMNLVTNAAEAMERSHGTITVATKLTVIGPDQVWSAHRQKHLPTGTYVSLEIIDTGCGMPEEVVAKIFDPFFTTKFTGRGLGLAAVQGIAHSHGGALQVQSKPGHGSTFRLLLPCSTKKVTAPLVTAPPERWQGKGKILVIDDEPAVRAITTRLLELTGFTVLTASDGTTGLEIFRANSETIDAVIVDLTMPGINGLEVAAAMSELRPNLPTVLMSGYSVREVTLQYEGHGITGFVQKPFNREELIGAVRRALKQ